MSNKLASTPQWKWLMQQQRGIKPSKLKELYYTGEVVEIPKDEFKEVDGQMVSTGNFPSSMRGKKYRVIGIGNPPGFIQVSTILSNKQNRLKAQELRNIDPGPKEKIDSSHWKSGHWKVAKLVLRRDLERADNHWMRFGTKSAYRQYKIIEQFLEEKSQQNWDPDDDFSTKYLVKYRKAFSDSMNTRLDWNIRKDALNTLEEVRDRLKIPTYNKL